MESGRRSQYFVTMAHPTGYLVARFAYIREIHLTGPAFLVLKYAGRTK